MESLMSGLGFGLGMSVGVGAARFIGRGLRPIAREALRAGLIVGDTARSAVSAAGSAVANVTAETRGGLSDLYAEARAEREGGRSEKGNGRRYRRIEVTEE